MTVKAVKTKQDSFIINDFLTHENIHCAFVCPPCSSFNFSVICALVNNIKIKTALTCIFADLSTYIVIYKVVMITDCLLSAVWMIVATELKKLPVRICTCAKKIQLIYSKH